MSVKACRLRKGYSQNDIIALLGCSSQTVQRWDNGIRPHDYYVNKLCALLDVDAETLLREEPAPTPDMEAVLNIVNYIGEEAFCEKTRLQPITVRMWREGTRTQPRTLRKIAAALDVPVEDLLTTEKETL